LRQEFIRLAQPAGANSRELCRRSGISPPTAYNWLRRAEAGDAALADRSRRPQTTPSRTAPDLEAIILALRDQHPGRGARTLRHRLTALGHAPGRRPARSTPASAATVQARLTSIFRRYG
jgi:transposase-like protein